MAGKGFRVDLDEMHLALERLYQWTRRMEEAAAKASHETGLGREAVGTGFEEAYRLTSAHALAQVHVEDTAIHLARLGEEIARKIRFSYDAYQDSEYQA
jgi:hypothetical protein